MHYYVEVEPNRKGEYEVHMETCRLLPTAAERGYLGFHDNGWDAIEKAKRDFTRAVACPLCLAECYKN